MVRAPLLIFHSAVLIFRTVSYGTGSTPTLPGLLADRRLFLETVSCGFDGRRRDPKALQVSIQVLAWQSGTASLFAASVNSHLS